VSVAKNATVRTNDAEFALAGEEQKVSPLPGGSEEMVELFGHSAACGDTGLLSDVMQKVERSSFNAARKSFIFFFRIPD
jgi:hypothetical protein